MILRKEKEALVKKISKELQDHKTVAIMQISGVPDRLLQQTRNKLRENGAEVIITRKTLLERALGKNFEKLAQYLNGNVALVVSDKEPFELNKLVSSNVLQLQAKPGQTSPIDIMVKAGETDITPGQAVTELKAAGLDVQIQRNKVIIAKDKVVVEAGKKITTNIANALKLLGIKPFRVSTSLSVAYYDNILFTSRALSIDTAYVTNELLKCFAEADALSTSLGIVTSYNVSSFIRQAYARAITLGKYAKVPEPEILSMLLEEASAEANKLNSIVRGNVSAGGEAKDTNKQ